MCAGIYYKTLNVNQDATYEELRRAYKKLALKWHPDKNQDVGKEESDAKFKLICEAYDFLSNPNKREIYDSYGGDVENVEAKLMCSLEELYKGCVKKIKVQRIVKDQFGRMKNVDEILKITIKAGWKKGTEIRFSGKGKEGVIGTTASDLILVLEEKQHAIFQRVGNDLVVTKKMLLWEAIIGKTLRLTTLDGRDLKGKFEVTTNVVKSNYVLVVTNEGMPIFKEPGKYGNLRIKIDVIFPSRFRNI